MFACFRISICHPYIFERAHIYMTLSSPLFGLLYKQYITSSPISSLFYGHLHMILSRLLLPAFVSPTITILTPLLIRSPRLSSAKCSSSLLIKIFKSVITRRKKGISWFNSLHMGMFHTDRYSGLIFQCE